MTKQVEMTAENEQMKAPSEGAKGVKAKGKITTKDLTMMAMFVALMAICSWINIPFTVPFTLQTFAIFAAVAFLGMKRGTLSVLVYIILGVIGVPVFAGFSGGPGVLFGTTGGYIIGFLFTALISGFVIDRFGRKIWIMALGMVLGLVACYAFGTVWFIVLYTKANGAIGAVTALSWCVFPFILPDLAKIALAIGLHKSIGRFVK